MAGRGHTLALGPGLLSVRSLEPCFSRKAQLGAIPNSTKAPPNSGAGVSPGSRTRQPQACPKS